MERSQVDNTARGRAVPATESLGSGTKFGAVAKSGDGDFVDFFAALMVDNLF